MNLRLFLVFPLLLAPLAQAAQTSTVRIADAKLPFAVSLPRNWVGVDFKDGLSGINIASRPKAPAALMRFTFIPKQGKVLNLKDEFLGFERAVRQGGTTLRRISEKSARYGGVSGLTHVYELSQKNKKLRMQIWFGSGVKNFYNFQMTDQEATYSKNVGLFNSALRSIKFK